MKSFCCPVLYEESQICPRARSAISIKRSTPQNETVKGTTRSFAVGRITKGPSCVPLNLCVLSHQYAKQQMLAQARQASWMLSPHVASIVVVDRSAEACCRAELGECQSAPCIFMLLTCVPCRWQANQPCGSRLGVSYLKSENETWYLTALPAARGRSGRGARRSVRSSLQAGHSLRDDGHGG